MFMYGDFKGISDANPNGPSQDNQPHGADAFDPADWQDMPDFIAGDVVVLRGQDQLMTVETYCDECDEVTVVCVDAHGGLQCALFNSDVLVNLDVLADEDDDAREGWGGLTIEGDGGAVFITPGGGTGTIEGFGG